MLADMEDYWHNLPEHELRLYQTCSFLDPRLKRFDFPLVSEDWKEDAIASIKADYEMNWAPAVEGNANDDAAPAVATPCENPPKENEPPPSMGSFTDFMLTVSHLTNQPTPNANAPAAEAGEVAEEKVCEFQTYLNEAPVKMSTDILEWWGMNEERFPHIARMAAQYLGTPASSAAAERVFSISGRIYGDLSQNMNPETLEERMFAKINTGRRKK